MENKKQAIILSVVAIVALLSLIIGATYAYFQASGNSGSSTNVNVTTYTSDLLTFEIGDDIAVYADQTSFASGKGNATGSTYAKATLVANNKTNEATKNYYVYLNISENTFTYTQNESTPELLLTIKDTSGNEITSITGLTHKTVTDGKGASISGFDITTKSGVITLFDKREITATPTKTEEWNITVTFVNYNVNQTANAGKSFNAKLIIQQEEQKPTLSEYVISQYTGTQGDNALYYHTSTLDNGAGDNSYRYAGASESVNNFVCFGSTTKPCPIDNLYRIIGVFEDKVKLIKYDYATSALLGTDGDYDGSSTPNSSYYKGSLSKVDTYYWNYKNNTSINNGYGSNEWSTSLLNKINLNTNYLNNIGTTWSNLIEDATWKVSGHSSSEITPSEMYTAEITNATKTYGPSNGTSKIGLMYVSDYGFASSPSSWTTILANYYDSTDANGTYITALNWMYMGNEELTISPRSSNSFTMFTLSSSGYVSRNFALYGFVSRPVMYLKASVLYAGGLGTKDSPITLVV